MQFILDHLMTIILAGAVLLILAATQIHAQRSGVEQTASYATKTKALQFGEWLEDDILSLGENFGRNRFRFEVPEVDSLGNTRTFQFYSDAPQMAGDTLREMTRYRLLKVGDVDRGGQIIPIFQMTRSVASMPVVDGVAQTPAESDWSDDGYSIATLSTFKIRMLDRRGANTTDVEQGDFIRVEFSLIPQFPVEPEYIRELYWNATLKVRPFWEPPPTT
ncbi:MAG: hypothetical protein R3330_05990 [Saprospiraceae bacterium]|nr:hypothetical protein [Saprospiraceae bacterium]